MTTITVKLEGDRALLAKLERLGISVQDVLEAAVGAAAEIVRDDARTRAPAPHIEQETTKRTRRMVEVDVGPDDEHWYYRFIESGAAAHGISGSPLVFMGDSGMVYTTQVSHPGLTARPFLRPAFDSQSGEATDEMGKHWKRAVESV